MRTTRRTFIGRGLAGAVVATGLYTWRIEPHWLEIVQRPLPIANLPRSLAGRTLAQLSDIHVGERVDDDYVLAVFDRVRALAPDIVVYTGDFTSHHRHIVEQARRVYAQAARGRLATLGIFGNHDYGPAWRHPEMAEALLPVLDAGGIRVLRNAAVEVGGLDIVGLDDLWAKRFAPTGPLVHRDTTKAAIVLSHNPDTADEPGWAGYAGWILSGHTHGGQCKAPFLAPPIIPVRNRRYTSGEIDVDGRRRLYISRGIGHNLMVRFNVRPEVTLFTLQPA